MNADTCSTLANVFPVLVFAVVLSRGLVHRNIRLHRLGKWALYGAPTFGLIGTAVCVICGEIGGVPLSVGWPLWALFFLTLIATFIFVLAVLATDEAELEKP